MAFQGIGPRVVYTRQHLASGLLNKVSLPGAPLELGMQKSGWGFFPFGSGFVSPNCTCFFVINHDASLFV